MKIQTRITKVNDIVVDLEVSVVLDELENEIYKRLQSELRTNYDEIYLPKLGNYFVGSDGRAPREIDTIIRMKPGRFKKYKAAIETLQKLKEVFP